MQDTNNENIDAIIADAPVVDIIVAMDGTADVDPDVVQDPMANSKLCQLPKMFGELHDKRECAFGVVAGDPSSNGPQIDNGLRS